MLVGELRVLYPHLPIIVASGYDDTVLRMRFGSDPRIAFVRKPYNRDDISGAVRALRHPAADG